MATKYINMDRTLLRNGGRKAVRISEADFKDKFRKLYEKEEGEVISLADFTEKQISAYAILELTPKVEADLSKVTFDFENYEFAKDSAYVPAGEKAKAKKMMGINTLPNGLTFLGGMAGGDWESPLFFIIYWDGKSLRGYVPSYGNTFNLDFMTAFGSEEDNRKIDNDKARGLKKYSNVGKNIFDNYTTPYLEDQGVDPENDRESPNWDAMLEDIESRIVVS